MSRQGGSRGGHSHIHYADYPAWVLVAGTAAASLGFCGLVGIAGLGLADHAQSDRRRAVLAARLAAIHSVRAPAPAFSFVHAKAEKAGPCPDSGHWACTGAGAHGCGALGWTSEAGQRWTGAGCGPRGLHQRK